jgi:hypothetical protein
MSEEKTWYFATKGKSYGPFSQREIVTQFEKGAFTAADFVFCKGEMEGWIKAADIPGLCDSLTLSPEPEPERHGVPLYEKVAFDHAQDAKRVKKEREKRERTFWGRLKKQDQDSAQP